MIFFNFQKLGNKANTTGRQFWNIILYGVEILDFGNFGKLGCRKLIFCQKVVFQFLAVGLRELFYKGPS